MFELSETYTIILPICMLYVDAHTTVSPDDIDIIIIIIIILCERLVRAYLLYDACV